MSSYASSNSGLGPRKQLFEAPFYTGGTVTSVDGGVGLTGGPITAAGTLDLADTAVAPGAYGDATNVSQVTVDQQGRITAAVDVAIDQGVTSVGSGTGLTGGPITTTGTLNLADTAVTPATYGSASNVAQITVDQQGRITSAADVSIGSVVMDSNAAGDKFPTDTLVDGIWHGTDTKAEVTGSFSRTCIGNFATVHPTEDSSTSVGYLAYARNEASALGKNANCAGLYSVAVGADCTASTSSVALGADANAAINDCVAVGRTAGCLTGCVRGVAMGAFADTNGEYSLSLGYNGSMNANKGVRIGGNGPVDVGATTGEGAVAIGHRTKVTVDKGIAFGEDSLADTTTHPIAIETNAGGVTAGAPGVATAKLGIKINGSTYYIALT